MFILMEAAVAAVVAPGAAPSQVGPQARRWPFTVYVGNLLTNGALTLEDWCAWARVHDWAGVRYLVFQRELATTTEREHVQGYIHFSTVKRRFAVNKILHLKDTHMEVAGGKPCDNRAYCTSDDKRVPGTEYFEHGECPGGQGSRLTLVAASIKEHGLNKTIEANPQTYITCGRGMRDLDIFYKRQRVRSDSVHVIVICGTSGSGKSWWANKLYDPGDQNTFTMPAVPANGNAWFDGYDDQRTLVIDEFSGRVEYELMKNIMDPYKMQVPTKGAHAPALWDTVVITTNYHPNTWYPNDIDAWGLDTVSPIQRRIHTYIEANGNYNAGTQWYMVKSWISGVESDAIKVLPTRTDEAPPEPATVDAQSDATSSNALPTARHESDPTVEDMVVGWFQEDEAADNDCMPDDYIPQDTTWAPDNDDMGELEPLGPVTDLFGADARWDVL